MIFPIHHTFAPHVDHQYAWRSLCLLMQPWKWKESHAQNTLREVLHRKFDTEAFLFSSGRQALLALFKSLKLQPGEEVILQAYTCVVVPNAIRAAGFVPVYADIDPDTLNLTPKSVQKVLTTKTRAILCQHTFGISAPTKELRDFCDTHNLYFIEDCAHIIPDAKGPTEIGRYGDAIMLSFGRDKAISGITGGAILSRDAFASNALRRIEHDAKSLPFHITARLLLYPLLYFVARPFYGLVLGKIFLRIARDIHLLLPVTSIEEKKGHMSTTLHTLPEPCATLTLWQLSKLQQINDHRRWLVSFYEKSLRVILSQTLSLSNGSGAEGRKSAGPLQKYPLLIPKADQFRRKLKWYNIHLDDGWCGSAICPRGSKLTAADYTLKSNPNAERVSKTIFALPTHPTMTERQARILSYHLTKYLHEYS